MKKIIFALVFVIVFMGFALAAKTQTELSLEQRVKYCEQAIESLRQVMIEVTDEFALLGVRVTVLEDDVKKLQ